MKHKFIRVFFEADASLGSGGSGTGDGGDGGGGDNPPGADGAG